MLNCNTCNHFTVCKQMINIEKNYKSYIAIIVETIAILMCKQICSNTFKNEITDKLISYILCISILMFASK